MNISGNTKLIGLLGDPISHSLSPFMHNLSFNKVKKDYAYLCLPTGKKDLGKVLETLKIVGAKGANITYPNKIEILKYLDEASDEVQIIGSCNTILIDENKKIKGYNTDGRGFVKSLKNNSIDIKGKTFGIMGLGGAGSAIATCLGLEGLKRLYVKEVDFDKAKNVKKRLEEKIKGLEIILTKDQQDFAKNLDKMSLVINATPIGMGRSKDDSPMDPEYLRGFPLIIYDIIYSPLETTLLRKAKSYGLKVFNGIDMMINQGAISFNIWTGEEMDTKLIKERIVKLLK